MPRALSLLIRVALFVALVASAALFVDYQSAGAGGFCGEVGEGCGAVKSWALRYAWGRYIPVLGMVAVGGLALAAAWVRTPAHQRILAGAMVLAAMGALSFIGIQISIGATCQWCMAVDVAVVVAAFAAVAMVGHELPREGTGTRLLWSGASLVAVATPLLWEPPPPAPAEVPPEVQALFVGGKVNVVMFTDFQCPHCRRLHPVIDELARSDERVVLRRVMVPLRMHPGAEPAALAYLCAPDDKRDAVADALYEAGPEELTPSGVVKLGEARGLDPKRLSACMAQDSMLKQLEAEKALYTAAALRGLPSTFVQDQLVVGANEPAFLAAVDRALAGGDDEGGLALGWMFGFLGVVVVAASGASLVGGRGDDESDEAEV